MDCKYMYIYFYMHRLIDWLIDWERERERDTNPSISVKPMPLISCHHPSSSSSSSSSLHCLEEVFTPSPHLEQWHLTHKSFLSKEKWKHREKTGTEKARKNKKQKTKKHQKTEKTEKINAGRGEEPVLQFLPSFLFCSSFSLSSLVSFKPSSYSYSFLFFSFFFFFWGGLSFWAFWQNPKP